MTSRVNDRNGMAAITLVQARLKECAKSYQGVCIRSKRPYPRNKRIAPVAFSRMPVTIRSVILLLQLASLSFASFPLHASNVLSGQPFYPVANPIQPFGYGPVTEFLASADMGSGEQICQTQNVRLHCMSISGGNSCSEKEAPAGSLVSCGISANPHVDETRFQPVNCNGQANGDGGVSGLLGNIDWCLATGYMPTRLANTLYQYDDYVRLGVNLLYGGTIFELYGADKLDRILQNGGGAVQLSLWSFGPGSGNFPSGYFSMPTVEDQQNCDTTAYSTQSQCLAAHPGQPCAHGLDGPNVTACPTVYPCAMNGGFAGGPMNPIQAMSSPCNWALPQARVDSVLSSAPGQLTVTKSNPSNFARSDTFPLTWSQTTQVTGPYAMVTYTMKYSFQQSGNLFQEVPALFTHGGVGNYVYYYAGPQPYNDVNGPVTISDMSALSGSATLQLPNRTGPYDAGPTAAITEEWASSCDHTGTECITIACFSPTAQDINPSYTADTSYFALHGYFSLARSVNKTVTLFMFPYRFDDVVMGMSIRQWIYQLQKNPLYHH